MQKEKTGGKIFKTRHRPDDVSFTRMIILCIFGGLFGAHSFYVGRKIRGLISIGCIIAGIIVMIIFPISTDSTKGHPWREDIQPFPFDAFIVFAFVLWAVDILAIVIGRYKYPIRLGEVTDDKKE